MNSIHKIFFKFSEESHPVGSGTASSYVTAINKLNNALNSFHKFLSPGESLWDVHDIDRLTELYNFVKEEQKKADGGIFCNESAKSYWQKGFCSAAIKEFAKFLVLHARENQMLSAFESATNGSSLAKELSAIPLPKHSLLIDDNINLTSREGKTAIREVEVRQNQNVFRTMVLNNFDFKCCLTGLPVPEILRASHISAWAEDKENRLNPSNGLCLSATYDAAFDRHLISFDEDYRLILSSSLKEYYTNEAFKKFFNNLEGTSIALPQKFMPSQSLLSKHRERLVG